MPTSAEIRARARESLAGNWKYPVLHFLVYYLIVSGAGVVSYIPFIGWIVPMLLAGTLTFGLYSYYLIFSRRGTPTINDLFSGFERFGTTLALYLLMGLFVFLWTLLLIIPGIIAGFRYSQAYFILKDNPQIGALEAIRRSKALMAGHKGRLFVLMLSFIGWYIVGMLTCAIGFLWIAPYYYTALAHFYNDLTGRSVIMPPPPPPPSPYDGILAKQ
ncbi:DUF975 family protein [Cohnella cholangitidis]|uniref:DUF975 family protein n=1 Tax=Cohnella cholangitidis TaxID=2598458 RepID=A0A7G5BZD1_9BACL|nr:DUF975 family protein [Cohnella cholangitidis]QMV42315.1 DUF975 family protein [Cohnella cholangitidis]